MAPLVTVALYAALIASGVWFIATERPSISVTRLGLAAFCVVAFLSGPIVDGLEYEDAYVHTASAAWRTFHWLDSTNHYYSNVCFAGAVSDCVVEGSFGTQLLGFSTLIAMTRTLLGGWPIIANVLSAFAMLLTVQLVWTMLSASVRHPAARLFGIALLLTAPSYLLISGSAFAEPLFTLLLTLCLYLYVRLQDRGDLSKPGWILFVASGALMILAKKEGALLLLLIVVFAVWAKRWSAAFVSLILLATALCVFSILEAASRHSADIGQPAFQLSYVARLFPVFGEAAITPRYFGLLGLLAVPALILVARSRDRVSVQFAVILLAYTLVYSAHARHRFFVAGEPVQPFEMVRYVAVIAPITALLIARSIDPWWRPQWPSIIPNALVIAGLVASLSQLYAQRIDMAEDERNRVAALLDTPNAAVVYISPYSAALFAKADEKTLIVDADWALMPAVVSWLAEHARRGTTIALDPVICATSAPPQWITTCSHMQLLQRTF